MASMNGEQQLQDFAGNEGAFVYSYNKKISDTIRQYDLFYQKIVRVRKNILELLEEYQTLARKNDIFVDEAETIEESDEFNWKNLKNYETVQYYKDCASVKAEAYALFYNDNPKLAQYIVKEQESILRELSFLEKGFLSYTGKIGNIMINQTNHCMYARFIKLASDCIDAGCEKEDCIGILDKLISNILLFEKTWNQYAEEPVVIDHDTMEKLYGVVLSKGTKEEEPVVLEEQIPFEEVVQDCAVKLMSYASLSEEEIKEGKALLDQFYALNDRSSAEDDVRALRKKITVLFYKVYEAVFFETVQGITQNKLIDLFLNFGVFDERFLSGESLMSLENMMKVGTEGEGCHLYFMKDWLTAIYKGEKEPSKNEFDLDYADNLREQRKRGTLTKEEEKLLLSNAKEKVLYEMHNILQYISRLLYGQISTFTPILTEESLFIGPKKAFLSPDRVRESVEELKKIDYSVFFREQVYTNPEAGITREMVQVEVYPDIILFPVSGVNTMMWQDISDKRSCNPGRFCMPVFLNTDLHNEMVKLFGRFRWELCRTMQGAGWDKIMYPSLTSEYCDYIQFYKKNKTLSEEKKEKLKSLITKKKNNTREIFVNDYEIWVNSESTGAIRLNKVARGILATYVPFPREMRMKFADQPIFAEAMARFDREWHAKRKEMDLRCRTMEQRKGFVPEEMLKTKEYWEL